MARFSILQCECGRTSISWLTSMLVHGAALGGALVAADRLELEYSVARGRPVQVELSSRAQAAREMAADEEPRKVEIAAIIKPAIKAVTEPPKTEPLKTEPLRPRKLEVTKSAIKVPLLAKLDPPPIDSPPPPTPQPAPEIPEEHVETPPEQQHKPVDAPRRATLKPDTICAMASIALEQSTLGTSVDDLPRKLAINPSPIYPLDALLAGIEGRVVLRVLVNGAGLVRSADINRSSGVASLDASALAAIEAGGFLPLAVAVCRSSMKCSSR